MRVKKDFENAVNILKFLVLLLCVVGCLYETIGAFKKFLKRELGTTLEDVSSEEADDKYKDISFAFCIYYEHIYSTANCANYTKHDNGIHFDAFESACDIRPLLNCLNR